MWSYGESWILNDDEFLSLQRLIASFLAMRDFYGELIDEEIFEDGNYDYKLGGIKNMELKLME